MEDYGRTEPFHNAQVPLLHARVGAAPHVVAPQEAGALLPRQLLEGDDRVRSVALGVYLTAGLRGVHQRSALRGRLASAPVCRNLGLDQAEGGHRRRRALPTARLLVHTALQDWTHDT